MSLTGTLAEQRGFLGLKVDSTYRGGYIEGDRPPDGGIWGTHPVVTLHTGIRTGEVELKI